MTTSTDSSHPIQPVSCEHITFTGQVSKPDFLEWIVHRAKRLGLDGWVAHDRARQNVEVVVQGPPELIDAMALSCSLGPMTVWVERVDRRLLAKPNKKMQGFRALPGL